MRKIVNLLFCLSLLYLLGSCRAHRSVSVGDLSGWAQATVPFKVRMEGDISFSASGKAYLVKGEISYLSVRFLGMEVVSLYMDNDSIWIYDKTSGSLFADKIGRNPVTKKMFTAGDFQNYMLGINCKDKDFNFDIGNFKGKLYPESFIPLFGSEYASQWIGTASTDRDTENIAVLSWDFSQADWNPASLPQWKKPERPKHLLNTNSLFELIFNQ